MQVLQDNFFYHSHFRLGADGGLEDERKLLVEEQKLCRARTRKFSQETNRRRKVLEERRKQWDVQEQRLRQNILQQRRQRVQDATERFQRAHLPPSQRYRQSFRRNAPNIEDALNQIQGTFSSSAQESSVLSSNSNISRSCTPSPKPPTLSKSSLRQAISAVEAYTKLLQEQSMTCHMNSHQTEKTHEKQQNHSPQGSRLSDCCNSEILSSKDSLEDEDPNHSTKTLQFSCSSLLLDSEKPHPDLRKQHGACPAAGLTSLSALMLLGDNLPQSRKLHEHKQRKPDSPEGLNDKMHVSKASWGFTSTEQTTKTNTQPALHNCNLISVCEIITAGREHFEVNSPQSSPSDNIITNGVPPGNTALQSSCPKQDALLDLQQQRIHDDRQLKHPSATEILLPAKNGNNKDILFAAPTKPNLFLNDNITDNASQDGTLQQTGKENHYLPSQRESSASINNLNKVSNSEPNAQKPISTPSLQHACLSNIQSDTLSCLKCPEDKVQKLPISVGTSHSVCEVRFIKGILKKQSKYVSGDTPRLYGSGHLIFAKQVAVAIRDSVELTRTKAKDVEGSNTVKKKLRWFDEVERVEREDKKLSAMQQTKSKSYTLSQSSNQSEDHQQSLQSTVPGASKPGPAMTPPALTGYHFTKQAWADVGVQVSLPQEQADEVKVPWSSTRTAGPKVPRRERSARAGAGPVSSRTRKGSVIRPQSATEVNQIAKTQGKIMVPRPPPRTESVEEKTPCNKTPYGVDHTRVSCKHALSVEQPPHKDSPDGFLSPYTRHVIRTDSTVMYTPLPPSYTYPISEGNAKGTPSSGLQETQGCSRRRGADGEKGLCLDCTPTDEEISQLWHGVRSALTSKDVSDVEVLIPAFRKGNVVDPQTSLPHNGLLSALPQDGGLLPRLAISGDSLISWVKASAAKTMLRRQTLESGRVLRKPGLEQSRQPPGSGNRFPQPSQTAEPIRPFYGAYEAAFPGEGLENAAHLHLAEVNAGGRLEGKDFVAAVETAQTQRPRTVQQRGQQQGLTTISLEEQKILLSLDRLNHQLYCVREQMGGNGGTRGLVFMGAPSTSEARVTNHPKHRVSSANSHHRHHKRS